MRTCITALLAAFVTSACAATAAPDPSATASSALPTAASSAAPEPSPTPERGGALVIWARGDLPASFATALAGLPDVVATAHVRSSTLGLTSTRSATGEVLETYTNGFRVPVSVAAVDPAPYAATLTATETADAIRALRPGTVLLTRTGAELRGVGIGATVDVGGATALTVAGIVEDGATGRSEIVAHVTDAAQLGLDEDGTVYVRHAAAEGAATDALVDSVEALVPEDLTARVVEVGPDGERRRAPLVLSLTQVKARFGEPVFRPRAGERGIDLAPGFVAEHITDAEVPLLGTVRCHVGILDDLRAALTDIATEGLADQIDPSRYAGCFNPRRISSTSDRLSHHAWGIALDINVDLDAPGGGEVPHPGVIAAFARHGFRWGGDFLVPDNHHFEWVGDPASR